MDIQNALMQNGTGSSGMLAAQDVEGLRKALEAGYGSDMSQLTGGGALRIQSLDTTMQSTIQDNEHFRLFNKLPKTKATATVDEWTEQSGVGGHWGGSTNSETGVISEATGEYARRVGQVRYLMTRRQVSFVQTLQNAIADSEAIEQQNGALQLLTDAEYLAFEGDATVVPTEIDGIAAQIAALNSSDHVIDAEANSLSSINLINTAAATIAGAGNFGRPTDLFLSYLTQADFDTGLDPAFRVALTDNPNSTAIGTPVVGIRTSHGNIANQPDVFVRDGEQQKPFELEYPAKAAANTFAPASVTPGSPGSDTESKFGAAHAGNYYYAVAGINANGQSAVVVSSQVAMAAGQKVDIVIAPSTASTETGYVVYRGRLNGTNAVADLREMVRIPRAASGNTTYTDINRDIPGTSKAYVLNLAAGMTAMTWRQFLPMLKFPLYPTNSAIVPWAQLLFGYLRISKRRQHVVIKNVLPNGAVWRPFE